MSEADAELEQQITAVFEGMYNSILLGAKALGGSQNEIVKQLDNFVVDIGKVKLTGTAQEMQETLSTVLVVAQDNADRTIQQAQDQAKETLNLADKDAEAKLDNAKKEADLILADAHQKANQLLSEAHSEKARIESKTQELIAQGEQMRNALKMTAKNQYCSICLNC